MLNSFINSPMVCGLWGSARTYALITVFSLCFSYIVFSPFSFNSIFWSILAIFDSPKDQNLFFESATLFRLFSSDDPQKFKGVDFDPLQTSNITHRDNLLSRLLSSHLPSRPRTVPGSERVC